MRSQDSDTEIAVLTHINHTLITLLVEKLQGKGYLEPSDMSDAVEQEILYPTCASNDPEVEELRLETLRVCVLDALRHIRPQ